MVKQCKSSNCSAVHGIKPSPVRVMQNVSTPKFRTATVPSPAEDTIGHMALQYECGMLSELPDLESQSRLGIVYGRVSGISAVSPPRCCTAEPDNFNTASESGCVNFKQP